MRLLGRQRNTYVSDTKKSVVVTIMTNQSEPSL